MKKRTRALLTSISAILLALTILLGQSFTVIAANTEQTPEEIAARKRIPKYDPGFQTIPPRSPDEPRTRWIESWETIGKSIADPNLQQVRFASIFSPIEAARTTDIASQMYGIEIPEQIREGIPVDLPPFLMVYTTSYQTGSTFTAIPHEMSKAQFQKLITALPALLAK